MENADLNPLFYAPKAAALSECGWRHALVWRAPRPLPRVSPPCVFGSRSSGSCVSRFSSFAMCASSSLAIIFEVATKSDLEVERFEDALLGLGLP
jgi:hypothetical protein